MPSRFPDRWEFHRRCLGPDDHRSRGTGPRPALPRSRHLGSTRADVANVANVFDEPGIGAHPHDIQQKNAPCPRLHDKGNTALVVEHTPEPIAITDIVVDLGPGPGAEGAGRPSGRAAERHLPDRLLSR